MGCDWAKLTLEEINVQ